MPMTAGGDAEVGCWDSVLLEQLNEDAFIANLQARYQRDHIYTAIGTYLVAVNPFRPLPATYGPAQVSAYATRNPFKLPPHIYGLTNGAYQWLLDHNEDQCIVLAGESNAGKTESARLVVHFLSQVADARRAALASSPIAPTAAFTSSAAAPSSSTSSFAQSGRRTAAATQPSQHRQQHQHATEHSTPSAAAASQQHNHHHQPPQRTHRQPQRQPHHPLCRPRSVGSVPTTTSLPTASSHSCSAGAGRLGGLLKKQRSMDIEKAAGRRSTHEKSVDFDFSHHRSNDNLHTSIGTSRVRPHCARHCNHIATELLSPIMSPLSAAPPMCPACRTPSPQSAAQSASCPAHHYPGPPAYDPLFVAASPPPPQHNRQFALPHLVDHQQHQQHQQPHHQHTQHQCSCPGSPKEAQRSAVSARHRLSSSSSLLLASTHTTPAQTTTTTTTVAKKILKNSLARSASVRDARSSRSSTGSATDAPASAATATTTGVTTAEAEADVVQMRDRIAQAEVFLEAIGNATTLRNFNASRYGKFFDIEIDFKGDPIGGHITHYMLEKTRITMRKSGERNFHIFYQLLSGAEIQFLKLLKLQRNIDKYQLLRHASATEDDRCNFAYTKRSLEQLGFGTDETLAVFQVLAAILKLGNLVFVPATHIDGTEGCTVTNDYELEDAAELLQIDARTLLNCMTTTTTTRRVPDEHPHRHCNRAPAYADTSSSTSSASPPVAAVALAADRQRALLCRTLYGRLFAWLVHRINKALKAPAHVRPAQRQRGKRLGVLDLCGFETTAAANGRAGSAAFASFEQLCINYADERMHQHYVRNVIRHQTELYAREGLELAPIACFDNASTCELLDRPQFGLLALLDEPHVQRCADGATALAVRLRQCCAGHPSFVCGDGRGEEHRSGAATALVTTAGCVSAEAAAAKPMVAFQIRHFAGPVTYTTRDLIAKNTDPLPRHIAAALHHHSRLSIVQSLFPEGKHPIASTPSINTTTTTTTASSSAADPTAAAASTAVPTSCSTAATSGIAANTTSHAASLRTQLATLLQLIRPRKVHYVFCVTPNDRRPATAHFDLPLVQHQVRYHSLLPLVRLWRTGHCHSVEHQRFVERYKLLNVATWPHAPPTGGAGDCAGATTAVVAAVACIVQGLPLPAAEFTIGIRRVLVRSPRTVYELEGFRRARLNDLACLVQTAWRGWTKRRQFVRLRGSQLVIASAWRTWRECRFGIPFAGRRHLWGLYRVAREEYQAAKFRQQVEWASTVIHRQYKQWKRRQFLRTLLIRLPANSVSPLCVEWVTAPSFLADCSALLRHLFHRWRCHRYRRRFDQTARNRMREKVTASIIFRDRKASYARTLAHSFIGDYVRLRQNVQWRRICLETNDQYVVFADIVNKIARSSGKFVPILLVISTNSMLLLDQRTLQIKYRVPATEIYRLSLSPYMDDIAVVHVKADLNTNPNGRQQLSDDESGCLFQSEMTRKKGDFVFQTCHVIEIVTKLFLVVQNATAKPPEVHISTEFEANFGQQTVRLNFKCSTPATDLTSPEHGGAMSPSSSGSGVKCTRRGNRMEIIV